MTDPDSLLQEYIAAHQAAGAPPDPGPFLRRASPSDRPALAALIEARLQRAPRRPFDAAAFEEARRTPLMRSIEQAAGGVSGLWPALLPRLRDGARIKRADLVRDLARELEVAGREEKVGLYYHRMEQGLLPAEGVSSRVLDALAKLLSTSAEALRDAGQALTGGPGPAASPGAVYARAAPAEPAAAAAPPAAAAAAPPEEPDEVDRLFTGG